MATPSQKPTRTESDYQLSYKKIDSVTVVVREIVKWGAVVLIVRYCYYSIAALAGRSTLADIVVQLLGNLKVSDGILALFGTGGIVYGVGQRYLRRRHIQRVVQEKNRLEKMIDPKRTSSDLTERGTTRPGDEL